MARSIEESRIAYFPPVPQLRKACEAFEEGATVPVEVEEEPGKLVRTAHMHVFSMLTLQTSGSLRVHLIEMDAPPGRPLHNVAFYNHAARSGFLMPAKE